MLDIKLIREKPELVRKGLQDRGGKTVPDLEQLIAKDTEWRNVNAQLDELRAKRNKSADEVGRIKREKGKESGVGIRRSRIAKLANLRCLFYRFAVNKPFRILTLPCTNWLLSATR